jgi:hypothetical protein
VPPIDLNSKEVHALQSALTEAIRAGHEGVRRFIEPADGTLDAALTRRSHLIFGRRGSGKTSLLRKAIAEHNINRRPSAFVDLEPFKGHTYPDVLISVLMQFFESLKLWLDEAAVAPSNRTKTWKKWFSKPSKPPLTKAVAAQISSSIEAVLADLTVLLDAQDDAEIEVRQQMSAKDASEAKGSLSAGTPGGAIAAGVAGAQSSSRERTDDVLEKLRRSKAKFLHRRILDYQKLLSRVVDLAGADGLLVLDDLYYIRRSDQPQVVDYFHRLTKNQRMWLKVGTVRHRSSWYVRGDPPIGMNLGNDASEINLDITLEKYRTAKVFLTKVFDDIATEVGVARTELLTDGAVDRLVLASGRCGA